MATGGGGALAAAFEIAKAHHPSACFFGFSDRNCGAFDILRKHCLNTLQHKSACNQAISNEAHWFFRSNSCDCVILLYSRLISGELYEGIDCYNVHPSLLPSYKGFRAVEAAFLDHSVHFGVTIHKVDKTVDGGPIACQVKTIPTKRVIEYWQSLSYLMKVLLLVSFLDKALTNSEESKIRAISCSPYLPEIMQLSGISVRPSIQKSFLDVVSESSAYSLILRK